MNVTREIDDRLRFTRVLLDFQTWRPNSLKSKSHTEEMKMADIQKKRAEC